ncbi:hypothetical protein [Streptomyces omiyaensis]|uniref:SpdD protein n=1 Tax=Streptomyces omiyaensis TaxID=68247 RepID=A0ABW7C7I8_9ACTN
MAPIDRTAPPPAPERTEPAQQDGRQLPSKLPRWLTAVTVGAGVLATVSVVALGLLGHSEAATAAGVAGAAAFAAGGITVTVNFRK